MSSLFSFAGIFSLGGCASVSSLVDPPQPVIRWQVPVPAVVNAGDQLAAAETQAGNEQQCFALMGAGRSMEPVYPSGTALVVKERSYRVLRPGLAIVYRNQQGALVAHVLVQRLDAGWIARGLNNEHSDEELVTEGNYLGVILAAYAPAHRVAEIDLVGSKIGADGIDAGMLAALHQ